MSARRTRRRYGVALAATALAAAAVLGTATPASAGYEYCGTDVFWPANNRPANFCYVVFGSDYKGGPNGGDLNLSFEETVRLINGGSTVQIRGFASIATSDGLPASLYLQNDFRVRPAFNSVSVSTPVAGGGVSWIIERDGTLSRMTRNNQRSLRLDYSSNNGVQIRKRAESTSYTRGASAMVEYGTVGFPLSSSERIKVTFPWSS